MWNRLIRTVITILVTRSIILRDNPMRLTYFCAGDFFSSHYFPWANVDILSLYNAVALVDYSYYHPNQIEIQRSLFQYCPPHYRFFQVNVFPLIHCYWPNEWKMNLQTAIFPWSFYINPNTRCYRYPLGLWVPHSKHRSFSMLGRNSWRTRRVLAVVIKIIHRVRLLILFKNIELFLV